LNTYILIVAAAEWLLGTGRTSASADNGDWGTFKTDMTENVDLNGNPSMCRRILIVVIELLLNF